MEKGARSILRIMRVENLGLAHGRGQRQRAACNSLGVTGDVRDHARLFAGEQGSGGGQSPS